MQTLTRPLTPGTRSSVLVPSRVLKARSQRRGVATGAALEPEAGTMRLRSQAVARAQFVVYTGQGAMRLGLISPTWESGDFRLYVQKEGVLLVEFAGVKASYAQQQVGYGDRPYNWKDKVLFRLNVTELGTFLDDKLIKEQGISLYHDPDKGGQSEGTTKKTFAVKMNPDESFTFSISQTDKTGGKTSVAVPVTPAEMAVIRTLIQFCIPHLLGFDVAADSIRGPS